jgi:sugar-specific transcriptional regulator TrmB
MKEMKTTVKNSIDVDTTNIEELDGGGLVLKDNFKLLAQLTKVLSVLSKNDALTIFLMAEEGIRSELDTPTKIGLTKKQYYTRLKQLVDFGLVVKHNESYMQTAFGRVVYQKHILGLAKNIKNSKYLQMIDVLKANPKFNDKDIMEFISKVEPQINTDLHESSKKDSTVISSYEDMVRKISETIEFAQNEILFVTRFQNDLIIKSILKNTSSRVNIKILVDTGMIKEYEKGTEIKSDTNKTGHVKVVSNSFYPSKTDRRYVHAPFCLLVVDNKYVGLEIVDISEPEKFKTAIFTEDPILSSSMITLFNNLWQKSDVNPPRIITKTV